MSSRRALAGDSGRQRRGKLYLGNMPTGRAGLARTDWLRGNEHDQGNNNAKEKRTMGWREPSGADVQTNRMWLDFWTAAVAIPEQFDGVEVSAALIKHVAPTQPKKIGVGRFGHGRWIVQTDGRRRHRCLELP